MTEDQIEIAKKLDELKRKIQNSSDPEAMGYLIKEAVKRVREGKFITNDKKGQKMIIEMLESEEVRIIDGTFPDIETARFQVSASIGLLMIEVTGAGIDELNKVLKQ